MANPDRFTGRVESYQAARPSYPAEIVDLLRQHGALTPASRVADIASGTGIFTQLLLTEGNAVIAVEPNPEMRAACARLGERFPKLSVVDGTAEHTQLAAGSCELVTVAQAMHWFQLPLAREEFHRILTPGGWCAVIYNHRHLTGDGFHDDYEALLRGFGVDYERVRDAHPGEEQMRAFFAPSAMQQLHLANHQQLTLQGLIDRLRSNSYMPAPGHQRYSAMLQAAEALFTAHQHGGLVRIDYDCAVSLGHLAARNA